MDSALAPAVSALGTRGRARGQIGPGERLEVNLMAHREGRQNRETIARSLEEQTKWRSVRGLHPHPIGERLRLAWRFPPFDQRFGNRRHACALRGRCQEVARQGGPFPLLELFAGSNWALFGDKGFVVENEKIGGARA